MLESHKYMCQNAQKPVWALGSLPWVHNNYHDIQITNFIILWRQNTIQVFL